MESNIDPIQFDRAGIEIEYTQPPVAAELDQAGRVLRVIDEA